MYLKIKEATNKGYAEAYVGDGVNLGVPNSKTRRGRVQNGGVNTLTTQSEMGVVVYDEQNKKIHENADTINTVMADGSSPKKNARVSQGLRIRKLTPKECWRLQGWGFQRDDGSWDDSAFEKAKAAGVSDSQLYKQAGNGCSANVVEAIGRKLLDV